MKHMSGFERASHVGRMRPEVRGLLMWRHFEGSDEAHRAYEHGYAVIEEPPRHRFQEGKLTAQGDPSMEQSEGRNFTDDRSEIVQEASPLVSCFWCKRLHPGEHPLSVCPACAARYLTMRSLEMSGSYPLSDEAIDEALTRTSPGNYALGYMDDTTFVVFYVGRSDSDVRHRLHEWVGAPSRYDRYAPASKATWASRRSGLMPLGAPALGRVGVDVDSSYTRFAYSYAPSAEAAFEKECRNYDDFAGSGELDNEAPPVRSSWECLAHPS
jgi:hypothetical protein